MPEPLKNAYNKKYIATLSKEIAVWHPAFKQQDFQRSIFNADWPNKELKQRMQHISQTLATFLPDNYAEALAILKPASVNFGGFEGMFFPDFVEQYGIAHYQDSIQALEHFTQYSSSEFAVRPFIVRYKKTMMKQMLKWSRSNNYHVRRLASEGCRPRLPWANALPEFKKDPTEILPILERLKADDSEYVRRSVANNLNDIAKDHPAIVLEISESWLGDNPDTDRLIKHACRTLLKKAHPQALTLFGYPDPSHIHIQNVNVDKKVKFEARLGFSFTLTTQDQQRDQALGKLRIEYAIDFMKSNGKRSRKVFKISELECNASEKSYSKSHSFEDRSTRKHYLGIHKLSILVNGVELSQKQFELINA